MNIAAYLPQLHGGYLPAWLLLVSKLRTLAQNHTDNLCLPDRPP